MRLTLSLWNLYEIGSAEDIGQRDRRLSFLQSFSPLWIVERVDVQRQEVRRFLWETFFKIRSEDLRVFTCHLSVVDSYHAGAEARIGLTARQWIDGLDFTTLERYKNFAPAALKTLQNADKIAMAKLQSEIFKQWIVGLLPAAGPDGKLLSPMQHSELLDHCERHRKQFLVACKSLAVEDALTVARTTDAKRNPQRSDSIDLQHTVMALAYCDYFLVRDGYVKACTTRVSKLISSARVAKVYDDVQRLHDDLATEDGQPKGRV